MLKQNYKKIPRTPWKLTLADRSLIVSRKIDNGEIALNICLYTSSALPKRGGQEIVVDALAREFLRLQHQVTVLAPMPRFPLRIDDRQFPYRIVRHPRFYSTRRLVPWYRWFLLRLFHKEKFDILHCHGVYPPGFLAALCREQLPSPIVVTSHEGGLSDGNVRLAKPLLHRRYVEALSHADALVAVSQMVEDDYRRLCPGADLIRQIPNGVDLEGRGEPTRRPVNLGADIVPRQYFLFLGRLTRRKGVDWLLRAYAQLPSDQRKTLVVAGEGSEAGSLQALARRLLLQDSVSFVGWADGARKKYLLQNALCVVVPSRLPEAFGLVVLESYAAGRPVIVSRVPGLEELVTAGESGLIVPPDLESALAQALALVAANPGWADIMGDRAREKARGYGWAEVAARHLDLYAELMVSPARLGAAVSNSVQ